ncbi:hypothetical protein FNV43_RR11818 [Rhamnella rubrinervis]|uniref:Uncharacterized protein n=1 Tax=Rhamnella rubrinervis TaxID=2594499 RepID=A0A8K0H750_9ROSA|nr:hypothetical protein FNV43_RR11818 [Rhamnella rubrinervis]
MAGEAVTEIGSEMMDDRQDEITSGRYLGCDSLPKVHSDDVVQEEGVPEDYIQRFNDMKVEIMDCPDVVACNAFKRDRSKTKIYDYMVLRNLAKEGQSVGGEEYRADSTAVALDNSLEYPRDKEMAGRDTRHDISHEDALVVTRRWKSAVKRILVDNGLGNIIFLKDYVTNGNPGCPISNSTAATLVGVAQVEKMDAWRISEEVLPDPTTPLNYQDRDTLGPEIRTRSARQSGGSSPRRNQIINEEIASYAARLKTPGYFIKGWSTRCSQPNRVPQWSLHRDIWSSLSAHDHIRTPKLRALRLIRVEARLRLRKHREAQIKWENSGLESIYFKVVDHCISFFRYLKGNKGFVDVRM